MHLTVHIPSDDFDEAVLAITAAFRVGEVTMTSHKKIKCISLEVEDTVLRARDKILHACPDAEIAEQDS